MASDPLTEAAAAASHLAELTGRSGHEVVVVLGTGLAGAADALGRPRARIPFSALPGFPEPTVPGHRPEALSIEVGGRAVLVLCGRSHLYEGRTPAEVVHGVRTAAAAGCTRAVLTNAAGTLDRGLPVGDPVLISDHLHLAGASPLIGLPGPPAFVDLTRAWSPRLRDLARRVDPTLADGVYAQLGGPHFETPAEIRMLRAAGADLVGMSTVPEAIALRHLGVELLGISVVTNLAAGLDAGDGGEPGEVSAAAVGEVSRRAVPRVGALLAGVLPGL